MGVPAKAILHLLNNNGHSKQAIYLLMLQTNCLPHQNESSTGAHENNPPCIYSTTIMNNGDYDMKPKVLDLTRTDYQKIVNHS